jgi:hypothetical protein
VEKAVVGYYKGQFILNGIVLEWWSVVIKVAWDMKDPYKNVLWESDKLWLSCHLKRCSIVADLEFYEGKSLQLLRIGIPNVHGYVLRYVAKTR